jgi:hypothetical protein
MVEITTYGDLPGRKWIPGPHEACEDCGWLGAPIEFKRHVYSPPHVWIRPGSAAPLADWIMDGTGILPAPEVMDLQITRIYCGPPAEYPAPPTPEDLLRSAGLDYLIT